MASILNNKYWINKSLIEKKENQRAAYKIQIYNNNVIDKYIEDFTNDETILRPLQATLYSDLWILNKPHVNKQYQRILNSKYTSDKALFGMLVKNKADNGIVYGLGASIYQLLLKQNLKELIRI